MPTGTFWVESKRLPTEGSPSFSHILDDTTVTLFWTWLVGCATATWLGMANIGNTAHIAGLLFGALVGQWLILKRRPAISSIATGLLAFWSPWSPDRVSHKAYKAHLARKYDAAIAGYRRSIALGGDRIWALENIALASQAKGADKDYSATIVELRALDPTAAARVEEEASHFVPGVSR